MALKRKKLDAICAHLKKTSAVDVSAITQNGVGDDVDEAEDNEVKNTFKPSSTTNNNEETVTDLNEKSVPVSSGVSSSEDSSPKPPSQNGETSVKDDIPNTSTSCAVSDYTPATGTSAASQPQRIPATKTLSSIADVRPTGAGRRKCRKTAKHRQVLLPCEQFDSGLLEAEGPKKQSIEGKRLDEKSSSFIHFSQIQNEIALPKEIDASQIEPGQSSPSNFANQYSLQQQPKQSIHFPGLNLSSVPLDLSKSRTPDSCESHSADVSVFDKDNENHNTADDSSTCSSTAASSSAPTHPSHAVVNTEAKVLADYAKNTMNELLSIYGFGGPGVEGMDKQLAQKQLENLSNPRALALKTQCKISSVPEIRKEDDDSEDDTSNKQPTGHSVQRDESAIASNLNEGRRFLKPNAVPALFVYAKKDSEKRKRTSYEFGFSVECPSTSTSACEINEEPHLKDASGQTEDDVITPLLNMLKEKDREIDTLRNQICDLNKTLSNFRLHHSFQHDSSDK